MDEKETIAAIATAHGRGAVAIVRVSGPASFSIAAALTGKTVDAARAGRFFRAKLTAANGTALDEALVLVFKGPASYTGEDCVEFQTHGGDVTPNRVLAAACAAGARLARRGEFTLRAFLNGRLDLAAAEAVIDLVDARSGRAADEALARLQGGLSRPLEALYAETIGLSAEIEQMLDVSEGELPPGFTEGLTARRHALVAQIDTLLKGAAEGKCLRAGVLVVLAGPPNAGKSSLLNALLGENRAIVSDVAGTTRDTIEEHVAWDGWPIRLVDTAGLRAAEEQIEAEGVRRAEKLLAEADVVIAFDSSCGRPRTSAPTNPPLVGADVLGGPQCHIFIHAKCDLGRGPGLNVSAKTGEGLAELKAAVVARIKERAAAGDEQGADVTERMCEFLRAARAHLAAVDLPDPVLAANAVRAAAENIGRILGKTYSEDLLDTLFSRFCVGK